MNRDLAREYREAMEEFCNLLTGLKLLGDDAADDLRSRIEAAQDRCDQVRIALFAARSTPNR
jgi:hypothetical protein